MADVALVCGAGGALGAALVSAFLARGDRIVAVDRSARDPGPTGVRSEAVDLADADAVEELWARLEADGELPRWLVNAVGGFRPAPLAATEPEDYRFMIDLNLSTAVWSCRAAARRMTEGSGIVNVSARSALVGGSGSAAYSVAKAGVVRLTQVLALELAERRVRVNAILPSLIDTPANRAALSPEQASRAVPPEQVASVAAFLCSDRAAAVSGAIVPAYGWA